MRILIHLFGLLCVTLAVLLGLLALFGYLVSDDTTGRVLAGFLATVALLLLILGIRACRHGGQHESLVSAPVTDPPTEKQRRYAAKLGIDVPPTMSKAELSAAIAEAERRNPALALRREQIKAKIREKKFGKALIEEEDRWNRFADEVGYMLAVYTRGKEKIVDVLRVNEAFIDDRGKLKLGVEAPRVVKDRYLGVHLEWDKYFELPIESLLYYEPLDPEFYDLDAHGYGSRNKAYREIVAKGLKIARKL